MLTTDDRDILQKMAERALAFIFDHCDDDQYCAVTSILVNGMREICDRERQFQHELGVGGNVSNSRVDTQANNVPFPPLMNEEGLNRISGIGANIRG